MWLHVHQEGLADVSKHLCALILPEKHWCCWLDELVAVISCDRLQQSRSAFFRIHALLAQVRNFDTMCLVLFAVRCCYRLSRCSIDDIKPHRLQGVQQYVTRYKSQWDSWGVNTEINQFFGAHAQSTPEPGVVGAVAMRIANIQI